MNEWVIVSTGKILDGGGQVMSSVGNLSSGSAPSGRETGTTSMAADPSEVGRTTVGEGGLISEGTLRTGGDLKFSGSLRICNKVTVTALFKIGWRVRGGWI
jgi:hypothetical protein